MSDLRSYTTASLGIRNNNPGNLRDSGIAWKGRIGSNKGFVVFSSVEYGIRAMAMDIKHDINTQKLNTITKLITSYAPPSENDTTAYINRVSANSGIGADQVINANPITLFKLIKAQIKVEDGNYAYLVTDKMINDGIALMNSSALPIAATGVGLLLVIGIIIGFIYFNK